jgi:hypothetical protein
MGEMQTISESAMMLCLKDHDPRESWSSPVL